MRIIRIIFTFIFVIIGLYLVASLFIPSNYKVERTITLSAPTDIVFEQIASFKNWEKWSSGKYKDPEMKTLFGPNAEKAGSYWLWKGDKVGEGRMTCTDIEDQKKLSYHLSLSKPYESESDGYIMI